jgi:hypothetical protein
MASACAGKTVRRWNLQSGEEIVEARVVCDKEVTAVAVSRDGRWLSLLVEIVLKLAMTLSMRNSNPARLTRESRDRLKATDE